MLRIHLSGQMRRDFREPARNVPFVHEHRKRRQSQAAELRNESAKKRSALPLGTRSSKSLVDLTSRSYFFFLVDFLAAFLAGFLAVFFFAAMVITYVLVKVILAKCFRLVRIITENRALSSANAAKTVSDLHCNRKNLEYNICPQIFRHRPLTI